MTAAAGWRSKGLRRYQRLTRRAEALIAGAYLAGPNTRRVRRALAALFDGAVGKDVVSRAWRKVRTDWQAWNVRELHDEDVVRLILDGTVVRAKIDRKFRGLGYEGGYEAVRRYAATWRRRGSTGAAAFVPLSFDPARPTSSTGATRSC